MGENPSPPSIIIGFNFIMLITYFIYFHSEVSNICDLLPEIIRRHGQAADIMRDFFWRPFCWWHDFCQCTKLWVYTTTILSVLLYATEIRPLKKTVTSYIHDWVLCSRDHWSLIKCPIRNSAERLSSTKVFYQCELPSLNWWWLHGKPCSH